MTNASVRLGTGRPALVGHAEKVEGTRGRRPQGVAHSGPAGRRPTEMLTPAGLAGLRAGLEALSETMEQMGKGTQWGTSQLVSADLVHDHRCTSGPPTRRPPHGTCDYVACADLLVGGPERRSEAVPDANSGRLKKETIVPLMICRC